MLVHIIYIIKFIHKRIIVNVIKSYMGGKEIIMYIKTRDFNAAQCMIWMVKFNPGKVDIYMQYDYPRYLIFLTHFNHLRFPEGWYYACDTKTINNHDSSITIRVIIKE